MNKIKRQVDIIYNDNVKRDLTIIHIADIHFNKDTKYQKLNKIKEEIIKNNPDYLVITGDLLDEPSITKNKYKIKELLLFLTELSKFSKILISLGNHDIFKESDKIFFKKLNEINNIYVLDNEAYQDEFIYISGLTLPTNYYYNMSHSESLEVLLEHLDNHPSLINNLPPKYPKVMLIHSPIKLTNQEVIKKLHEYNLLLSGHMHGGMIPDFLSRFFKPNMGIIAPNKKLFPEVSRGKIEKYYQNKKLTLIITGGITKLSVRSTKILNKLNFIYNISINKIIITKKRGKNYE